MRNCQELKGKGIENSTCGSHTGLGWYIGVSTIFKVERTEVSKQLNVRGQGKTRIDQT